MKKLLCKQATVFLILVLLVVIFPTMGNALIDDKQNSQETSGDLEAPSLDGIVILRAGSKGVIPNGFCDKSSYYYLDDVPRATRIYDAVTGEFVGFDWEIPREAWLSTLVYRPLSTPTPLEAAQYDSRFYMNNRIMYDENKFFIEEI